MISKTKDEKYENNKVYWNIFFFCIGIFTGIIFAELLRLIQK